MSTNDQGASADARRGYSTHFDDAVALAAIVHRNADRKGTRVPYVIHPVQVSMALERHGLPEHVQIAGLLHDVIEDVEPSDREVRARLLDVFPKAVAGAVDDASFKSALAEFIGQHFGRRVLELVDAMTQIKRGPDGLPIPIEERHRAALRKLQETSDTELIALKAADALHNTRSIVNDLQAKGLPMMARFKGAPDETLGYYEGIARTVEHHLGDTHALARELGEAVRDLRSTLERALDSAIENLHDVKRRVGPGGPTNTGG